MELLQGAIFPASFAKHLVISINPISPGSPKNPTSMCFGFLINNHRNRPKLSEALLGGLGGDEAAHPGGDQPDPDLTDASDGESSAAAAADDDDGRGGREHPAAPELPPSPPTPPKPPPMPPPAVGADEPPEPPAMPAAAGADVPKAAKGANYIDILGLDGAVINGKGGLVGYSVRCPTCGQSKDLHFVRSGMSSDEAKRRLYRWATICVEDHRLAGGRLLKDCV